MVLTMLWQRGDKHKTLFENVFMFSSGCCHVSPKVCIYLDIYKYIQGEPKNVTHTFSNKNVASNFINSIFGIPIEHSFT